jgi:hypothetical protein
VAGSAEVSLEDGASCAVTLLAGAGASAEAGRGGCSDDGCAEGCAGFGSYVEESTGTFD